MLKLFTPDEIKAINAPIAEARGLPPRAFYDPLIFEAERQRIFFDGWCAVSFADLVPLAGDAMPIDFIGAPLLLARQTDGALKLFHNLVPYDAAPVLYEAVKGADSLTGTYHGLVYSLDGKLRSAPYWDGHEGVERHPVGNKNFDLIEIPCAEWGRVVFANIAGNKTNGFTDYIAPIKAELGALNPAKMGPALNEDGSVAHWQAAAVGNWKTHHENACMNVFHENSVHEIYRISPSIPRVKNAIRSYREVNDRGLRGLAYTNEQAGETYFPIPLPDLPTKAERSEQNTIISLYPNLYYSVIGPHAHATIVTPSDPENVMLQSINYFAAEAATTESAVLAAMVDAGWVQAVTEDGRVIEAIQKGRRSPAAQPNHYAPFWDAGHYGFNRQILADLGESNDLS